MIRILSYCVIAFLVFGYGTPLTHCQQADQFIKVEVKGTIKTGVVAIGLETTGVTITAKPEGSEEVTWELDLNGDPALEKQANELKGKLGVASGNYVLRHGIEIKIRQIIKGQLP